MSILNAILSGGGSGLEFETGTFTPTSNTGSYTVNFSKTYSKPPAIFIAMTSGASGSPSYQITFFGVVDIYSITHQLWASNTNTPDAYGYLAAETSYSSGQSNNRSNILTLGSDYSGTPPQNCTRYYMREDSATITNVYNGTLMANCKMSWVAIWLPDNWTPPV